MEKTILAYVDLDGISHLARRLWVRARGNNDSKYRYSHFSSKIENSEGPILARRDRRCALNAPEINELLGCCPGVL